MYHSRVIVFKEIQTDNETRYQWFKLDEDNKLTTNIELNKLLVPTPQNADINGDGTISSLENEQTKNNYIKGYNKN